METRVENNRLSRHHGRPTNDDEGYVEDALRREGMSFKRKTIEYNPMPHVETRKLQK
jgi:hypothetical protein